MSSHNSEHTTRQDASSSSLQDDHWVVLAVKGDEKAYSELTQKYQKPLYFHVRKMIRNPDFAEDLVQDIFLKAFKSLKNYKNDYALSTWLYRIATNHTIDYLRKKKLETLSIHADESDDTHATIQLADEDSFTDEPMIKRERKNKVHEAIDQLPEKYKEVILKRHIEEKSYQEISEEMDIPLGTVKAHIFRARELLYKYMKDTIQDY
ncbi:MAG: sigma-70 family RNA polymerase sigma factor [Balneolaceae bacterium]|nr:sigma-70 family RNA polymerase sigma factor [Balneolaceae bacterium]